MALKPWRGPKAPAYTTNLLRAIKDFARYNGINFMPRATTERLRTDPYFKYCFAPLVLEHRVLYNATSQVSRELGEATRQRSIRLLKEPGSVMAKDLFYGIDHYLNNFVGYLPGGYKRESYVRYPDIYGVKKPLFDLIDKVLSERGWETRARELITEMDEERDLERNTVTYNESIGASERWVDYSKRLEHRKLCLAVFNILVEDHGQRPIELWT